MPTRRRRQPTGAQKRKRRIEKYRAQRAEFIAEHPTPFDGWHQSADRLREDVTTAIESLPNQPPTMMWRKGTKEKVRRLTVDDLAIALFAVEQVGADGLSFGQLDRCFRDCRGVGCHNNKASALLRTLVVLKLIRKVGNYSAGRRGNCYKRILPKADITTDVLPF